MIIFILSCVCNCSSYIYTLHIFRMFKKNFNSPGFAALGRPGEFHSLASNRPLSYPTDNEYNPRKATWYPTQPGLNPPVSSAWLLQHRAKHVHAYSLSGTGYRMCRILEQWWWTGNNIYVSCTDSRIGIFTCMEHASWQKSCHRSIPVLFRKIYISQTKPRSSILHLPFQTEPSGNTSRVYSKNNLLNNKYPHPKYFASIVPTN